MTCDVNRLAECCYPTEFELNVVNAYVQSALKLDVACHHTRLKISRVASASVHGFLLSPQRV